ncbi:MAG TPA: PA domain-containing protein [Thermodesulfobacteriota bacterium]|nr:PA domain-containing protein [Thermodesulfobacteriota bacterium]
MDIKKKSMFWVAICFVLIMGLPLIPLAVSATTFELVSPSPVIKTYQYPTDYKLFTGDGSTTFSSAPGDVTAPVQFVGYGNTDAYYAGFIPGNIALIERGGTGDLYFSTKVNFADNYGAIGAIIFDNSNLYPNVALQVQTFIPSIFTTDDVGAELLGYLRGGAVTVHISTGTAPVPEPTTMLLLGSGLIGLAGYGRKKFFKK